MSTVTYKKQPAIHATRGSVPLAGTAHVYRVKSVLWPEAVSNLIRSLFVGRTLHVCCGHSPVGDIRCDADESVRPDVKCDATSLPFADKAFDTVLCDPPYNGKFRWNHDLLSELSRVAGSRIIFQHWFIPADKDGLWKKWHRFYLSDAFVWQPRTYFGRAQIISVFDAVPDAS